MGTILLISQAVLAVTLTLLILLQLRGSGMGSGKNTATSFTRRGLDMLVFRLTFVVSGLFLLVSIVSLLI